MVQDSSQIKLLVAVPSLLCGGLERNVAWLVNHINTSKFNVTLAVINNRDPFFSITNSDVEIIDMHTLGARKAIPVLTHLTHQIKPDILLTAANHLNLLCAINKNKFPKKMKLIARESSIPSLNVKNGKFPWLYHFLLKKYYSKSDLVVCQSAYMKNDLVTHYRFSESTIKIIYNPVEIPVNQQWQKQDVPIFIYVGRLNPIKSVSDLVEIASRLDFNFRLHIVGSGPEEEMLKQKASDLLLTQKVFFHPETRDPFNITDKPNLFLCTSKYEGFPNAVLEAVSLGIPVIAYDAPGGISEIVQHKKNGLLVAPGEQDQFVTAIKSGLDMNFDSKEIQNDIQRRFSPNQIIASWEQMFEDLLKQHS